MPKKLTSINRSSDDINPVSHALEGSRMENLEDLVKQQLELEEKIRLLRDAKKQEKIASIKSEMKIYGISLEDLMDAEDQPKRRRRNGSANEKASNLPSLYRGPNGEEWSGRGRTPRWITESGMPKEHFRIKD